MVVIGLVTIFGCINTPQNPLEYNNKLMTVINENMRDMDDMNAAMTSANYRKAEQIRQNWVIHLESALKKVVAIGGFNGDDDFQTAVIKGLKGYKDAVANDYKRLIVIRNTGQQEAQEMQLLNHINDIFSQEGKAINKAADSFQALYGR